MKQLLVIVLLSLAMSDLTLLRQLHDEIEEILQMYEVQSPVDFSDCGGEQGTVTTVDVTPNPPAIGKSVTLKVVGATRSAFDITKLTATAYVAGIPISSQTVAVSQSCPLGTCEVSLTIDVPSIIPPGTYQIEAKAGNDKSSNLVCGKATVQLIKSELEDNVPVKDCGGSSATVSAVDVSPYPPKIGSTITISVKGTAKKAFTVTKLKATVYVGGVPLSTQTIASSGSCAVGACTIHQSLSVPSIVPAGTYDVQVQAQNGQDANLVCGKATLKLVNQIEDEVEQAVPVKDCGGAFGTVSSVDVTPYPPVIGKNVVIKVTGNAKQAFTTEKLSATVYTAGVPISTQTIQQSSTCSVGSCSVTLSLNVPSVVPAGTYDVEVKSQSSKSSNQMCGKATIKLVKAIEKSVPVKDCGGAFGSVSSVDVTPYPPVIGKNVAIQVTGNAKQAFTTEKISATVYTAGVPISTQTIQQSSTCSVGSCSMTLNLNVPSIVPAGTYDVEVKSQSSKSSNQMCGKATIQLSKDYQRFEQSIDFTDCGGDQGSVTVVDVSPYPPTIGQDVTLDVTGTTKSAFEVTKLKATVYVAGIPITSQTVALQASCPAGTCSIHQTLNVPSIVPAGTYTLEVQAQNGNDSNLVCAKAKITIQ